MRGFVVPLFPIGPRPQLPRVALVCNFSSGSLMHSEVETLLHEMVRKRRLRLTNDALPACAGPTSPPLLSLQGHALHSALSRTEFQHLSGTRGSLDFVEARPAASARLSSRPALCTQAGGHGLLTSPPPTPHPPLDRSRATSSSGWRGSPRRSRS